MFCGSCRMQLLPLGYQRILKSFGFIDSFFFLKISNIIDLSRPRRGQKLHPLPIGRIGGGLFVKA